MNARIKSKSAALSYGCTGCRTEVARKDQLYQLCTIVPYAAPVDSGSKRPVREPTRDKLLGGTRPVASDPRGALAKAVQCGEINHSSARIFGAQFNKG